MICQVLVTDGGVITITDERTFAFADQAALTVLARAANSAGAPTLLTHASNGRVLMRTGNTLAFAQLEAGSFPNDIVTLAAMAANSVDSDQYVDGSIDLIHMSDDSVDTDELVDDSVDDTKAGNRVPQFYRRQGGSATNWHTSGDTDYTPTAVRMQSGSRNDLDGNGVVEVTFPVAFSDVPMVFATCGDTTLQSAEVFNISASDCDIRLVEHLYADPWHKVSTGGRVFWLAIGPE